jgi:hypothetical protein
VRLQFYLISSSQSADIHPRFQTVIGRGEQRGYLAHLKAVKRLGRNLSAEEIQALSRLRTAQSALKRLQLAR